MLENKGQTQTLKHSHNLSDAGITLCLVSFFGCVRVRDFHCQWQL